MHLDKAARKKILKVSNSAICFEKGFSLLVVPIYISSKIGDVSAMLKMQSASLRCSHGSNSVKGRTVNTSLNRRDGCMKEKRCFELFYCFK